MVVIKTAVSFQSPPFIPKIKAPRTPSNGARVLSSAIYVSYMRTMIRPAVAIVRHSNPVKITLAKSRFHSITPSPRMQGKEEPDSESAEYDGAANTQKAFEAQRGLFLSLRTFVERERSQCRQRGCQVDNHVPHNSPAVIVHGNISSRISIRAKTKTAGTANQSVD